LFCVLVRCCFGCQRGCVYLILCGRLLVVLFQFCSLCLSVHVLLLCCRFPGCRRTNGAACLWRSLVVLVPVLCVLSCCFDAGFVMLTDAWHGTAQCSNTYSCITFCDWWLDCFVKGAIWRMDLKQIITCY
jgi:hypothetical protein